MNMKKIILAAFVIMTFVVYSVNQRGGGSTPLATNTSATSTASTASNPTTGTPPAGVSYKDGVYTGVAADAIYGYIQVKTTITGGKITDVVFLQYPNDRSNSVNINNQAMPMLKQQALKTQTSQVDGVSGATDTTQAFIQSLGDALQQAKA